MLADNTKDGIEQYYLKSDVNRAITGLLLLLIPLSLYVLNDYRFLGFSQEFLGIIILRRGLVLYTILMVLYLRRIENTFFI